MKFVWVCMLGVIAALLSSCAASEPKLNKTVTEVEDARFILGDGGVSPFYQYAAELPVEPGTLLRQEPLEKHQSVPGAASSYRLLYTSTDGLGGEDTVVVSGTLHVPPGTPPEGGWPLLMWSHGTVGIADKCAPSWTGYVPFHNDHLQ